MSEPQVPVDNLKCAVCQRALQFASGKACAATALGFPATPETAQAFFRQFPELVEIEWPVFICPVCYLNALGALDKIPPKEKFN